MSFARLAGLDEELRDAVHFDSWATIDAFRRASTPQLETLLGELEELARRVQGQEARVASTHDLFMKTLSGKSSTVYNEVVASLLGDLQPAMSKGRRVSGTSRSNSKRSFRGGMIAPGQPGREGARQSATANAHGSGKKGASNHGSLQMEYGNSVNSNSSSNHGGRNSASVAAHHQQGRSAFGKGELRSSSSNHAVSERPGSSARGLGKRALSSSYTSSGRSNSSSTQGGTSFKRAKLAPSPAPGRGNNGLQQSQHQLQQASSSSSQHLSAGDEYWARVHAYFTVPEPDAIAQLAQLKNGFLRTRPVRRSQQYTSEGAQCASVLQVRPSALALRLLSVLAPMPREDSDARQPSGPRCFDIDDPSNASESAVCTVSGDRHLFDKSLLSQLSTLGALVTDDSELEQRLTALERERSSLSEGTPAMEDSCAQAVAREDNAVGAEGDGESRVVAQQGVFPGRMTATPPLEQALRSSPSVQEVRTESGSEGVCRSNNSADEQQNKQEGDDETLPEGPTIAVAARQEEDQSSHGVDGSAGVRSTAVLQPELHASLQDGAANEDMDRQGTAEAIETKNPRASMHAVTGAARVTAVVACETKTATATKPAKAISLRDDQDCSTTSEGKPCVKQNVEVGLRIGDRRDDDGDGDGEVMTHKDMLPVDEVAQEIEATDDELNAVIDQIDGKLVYLLRRVGPAELQKEREKLQKLHDAAQVNAKLRFLFQEYQHLHSEGMAVPTELEQEILNVLAHQRIALAPTTTPLPPSGAIFPSV